MLYLTLDQPTTGRGSVRLGPFDRIEVAHRRLRAAGFKLLRHFDGGWHWNEASYLEARIEPAPPTDRVRLTHTHAGRIATETTGGLRLYGGHAYTIPAGSWVATDDDDGRCWVAEASGLISEMVVLPAA